jgi:hypothetical protein
VDLDFNDLTIRNKTAVNKPSKKPIVVNKLTAAATEISAFAIK